MKTRDIARQCGLNQAAFDAWLQRSGHPYKAGLTGLSVADDVGIGDLVRSFNQFVVVEQARFAEEQLHQAHAHAEAERRAAHAHAEAERRAAQKREAMARMLVTSGFSFDGYAITRYSGYISGDDAISMNRPSQGWTGSVNGDVGADLLQGLVHIRRNALAELKDAAYELGCNAVIGVDFDYITLDPETVSSGGGTLYLPFLFAVTANGNAVVIEKS